MNRRAAALRTPTLDAVETPANWTWRDGVVEPAECAIFDMDGVISDASGRQGLLAGADRDWDRFFAAAGSDAVSADAAELLGILGASLQVVLLTARPVTIRDITVTWLADNAIAYDLLVMRPVADRGPSRRFKRAALAELRAVGFAPRIAFEDDIRNVEMFRSQGLPCVYIHSGYYE